MNRPVTLRRKLLVWLLFPMLALWILNTGIMYFLARRFVNEAYDYALVDSAHDLADQITGEGGKALLNLPSSALKIFLSDELDSISYSVVRRDRTLLSGEPGLSIPDTAMNPGNSSVRDDTFRGRRVRIAALPFLLPGLPSDQTVIIQVAETLNKRTKLAGKIIATMVLPQILLFVLPGIVVWIGIGRGLSPLAMLRKEIATRSHRDLSPLEESSTPQEVRPIIHEINDLMARLGKTLEAQQRFIADAAHQLRTPLSGLKVHTDLAKRQSDPADLQQTLTLIDTSADRAIRLVNQMLTLAQVESGARETLNLKPLDLAELLRETTKEWVSSALKRDVDIGYEGPELPIMVKGDVIRIRMLIDNLIDNAIKYSQTGSTVTTRIEETEGSVILTVEDNGPGIPFEEKQAVFQRFYRILGNSIAGSGLGLSIVKEIATSHGACVSIEDRVGHRGTSAKVTFPRILTL
ncbi:MAG TPA: sensor histidine kinase N-terminal domain-containing protein [Thermodesulfovibrionales bacterium]|nr:sensor histidine kinase N-terminal domain-containing protein [Thermodesulfovibrionales bacterium]